MMGDLQWGQHFPQDACVAVLHFLKLCVNPPVFRPFHPPIAGGISFVQDVVPLWTWQRCWP